MEFISYCLFKKKLIFIKMFFLSSQIPITLIMKFQEFLIGKKNLIIFHIVFHNFSSRTKSKNG